ncbi:MAG: anti-sigma factor [Pseudomonadota bacterium]|nr:anti-sigma factor [Pseudomonadota bacterium]
MDYGRSPLADALGAQYVAGTLRGGARRRFEALLPGHPALQQAVRDWQQRLMPLTDVLPEVAPPARVWRGIESRLWPAAAPSSRAPVSIWQRLGLWRAVSAVALAAVVGLAVLAGQPQPVLAPIVVVLQATGADPAGVGTIVASVSGDGHALVTRTLTPVALAPQRRLQLWAVPAAGSPHSLGLISADGATVLRRDQLPPTLLQGDTDALAVSIEPPGGSPTGVPTGPVVFAGKLQR